MWQLVLLILQLYQIIVTNCAVARIGVEELGGELAYLIEFALVQDIVGVAVLFKRIEAVIHSKDVLPACCLGERISKLYHALRIEVERVEGIMHFISHHVIGRYVVIVYISAYLCTYLILKQVVVHMIRKKDIHHYDTCGR